MASVLINTCTGFKNYINKINPDLVVVHGDRVESLACAAVSSLNNTKVAHIEGGELSGTIDETLRHSITKLSNFHFVTNNQAKKRLIQMGEKKNSIFKIGSPDVDIILSKNLPNLENVKKRYKIMFNSYAIALFHPVTSDIVNIEKHAKIFIESLILSEFNYILIFPNNDYGSEKIFNLYKKIKNKYSNIKIFPSIRFEFFLTLMKNANFIIGNSSSGIMEAPYYGLPVINIGSRQKNRAKIECIKNCNFSKVSIVKKINLYKNNKIRFKKIKFFGTGQSKKKFIKILNKKNSPIWTNSNQKYFNEISY
jgi:UDP-N-acetylglucosamine 2-epimerase (hydrolysing)